MKRVGGRFGRAARLVTIVATVLALVRVPFPQLDYHNIRHNDGPGEVCTYHDHLLRWHPQAGNTQEVTVLHWHWFTPADAGESLPNSPLDRNGPAWHAHVPVPEGLAGDDVVSVVSGHEPQLLARGVATLPVAEFVLPPPRSIGLGRDGLARLHGFAATFAPSTARIALLNRWNC